MTSSGHKDSSALIHILLRAGWAPLLVVLLHRVALLLDLRSQADAFVHFAGGIAAALVSYCAIDAFAHRLGRLTKAGTLVFSLSLASAVALGWELIEYASDRFLHTQVQKSVEETMLDLAFGVLGACVCVSILLAATRRSNRAE